MTTRAGGTTGREIQIESEDGRFSGYVAVPVLGSGPGILVLQEWWGLVPHIRDVCDRLARMGFVALAPDLYRGFSTTDPEAAGRMMMELEIERAGRDLSAALAALARQPEVEGARFGVMGFCMGGQLALHAACRSREIAAVVDCYGIHPGVVLDFDECRAKVLGVFAENDEFIPAEVVVALDETLGLANIEHRLVTYEGVGHAFLNDSRPEAFAADRAAEAWSDIEAFLTAELR